MRRYLLTFGASGVLAQQEVNEDVSIQLQKLNDNANDIDVHLVAPQTDYQYDTSGRALQTTSPVVYGGCKWTYPTGEETIDNQCYNPVCPAGYYKCCSDCKLSGCANKFPIWDSNREPTMPECIWCRSGYYCDGSDVLRTCGQVRTTIGVPGVGGATTEVRERLEDGDEGWIHRVAPAGAGREQDCVACETGLEPCYNYERCVGIWTNAHDTGHCSRWAMWNCIETKCQFPTYHKLTEPRDKAEAVCEQLKCATACAFRQSNECGANFRNSVCQSGRSKWIEEILQGTDEVFTCNVDCDSAAGVSTLLALSVALFSWLWQ